MTYFRLKHFYRVFISLFFVWTAASCDIPQPSVVEALEEEGAQVSTHGGVMSVDCTNAPFVPACNNYANTGMIYQGLMVPCNGSILGCNKHIRQFPFIKSSNWWQINMHEAILFFGDMPPQPTSHFSIQITHYERHNNFISNANDYIRPMTGEVIPEPNSPNRKVVDNSIGNSLNNHTLQTSSANQKLNTEQFVILITPNKSVAEKITHLLVESGIPIDGINIKGLPGSLVYSDDDTADSFRIVGRIGRPFDEKVIEEYASVKFNNVWRVQFPRQKLPKIPFEEDTFLPRETGERELNDSELRQYENLKQSVFEKFGEPDLTLSAKARYYDDKFCRNTGSYCWGNTHDSLYVDINDPETNRLAVFNFKNQESKLVIVGIDHQALGYADFWNLGVFNDDASSLKSILFSDIQKKGILDKNNEPLDKKAFFLQLKEICQKNDEHCYEINFNKDTASKKISLINRIYVNPKTGTGPSAEELILPTVYFYN
jgi:hypothetical protein